MNKLSCYIKSMLKILFILITSIFLLINIINTIVIRQSNTQKLCSKLYTVMYRAFCNYIKNASVFTEKL